MYKKCCKALLNVLLLSEKFLIVKIRLLKILIPE